MLYFFCFTKGRKKIGAINKKKGDLECPEKKDKKSSTKVYHTILRGNAKQDYEKFKKEIGKTKEKYQYDIYSYCIMTNHVHLIIFDPKDNLSKIMQSLTISYSSYWNKKKRKSGTCISKQIFK